MQNGHWVVCATATAISCLVCSDSAPSANTARLNASNASWVCGASSLRRAAISGVVGWYIASVGMNVSFEWGESGLLRPGPQDVAAAGDVGAAGRLGVGPGRRGGRPAHGASGVRG